MARYDSGSTEMQGQYPTTAWGAMGLPEQNEATGAPGSNGPGGGGGDTTTEPGQYPDRDTWTGVTLDGTGAPGSGSIGMPGGGGGDSVSYSRPTFYKGLNEEGGDQEGYFTEDASGSVSGPADWTQANTQSYGPGYNMPGVEGNTPTPDAGPFQPGSGRVLRGGYMKGQR